MNFPEKLAVLPVTQSIILPMTIITITVNSPCGKTVVDEALKNDKLLSLIQSEEIDELDFEKLSKVGMCVKIIGYEEVFEEEFSYYRLKILGISRFNIDDVLVKNQVYYAKCNWSKFFKDTQRSEAKPAFEKDLFLHLLKQYSESQGITLDFNIFDNLPNDKLVDFSALSLRLTKEQRELLLDSVDYNDRALLLMETMALGR